MYGAINHGLKTMVVDKFGEAEWDALLNVAGLDQADYNDMLTYPDEDTYALVGALCNRHGMAAEDALKAFGQFWIGYSRTTQVAKLIDVNQGKLAERLQSLNHMHDRMKMTMPHLRPPSFEFEEGEGNVHKLHYISEREGLAHLVIGLVEGMCAETGENVVITQDPEPMYDGVTATFTIVLT